MNKIIISLVISLLVADLTLAMGNAPKKEKQPDLVVTEVVVEKLPAKGVQMVRIKYTIRNQGNAVCPASISGIRLQGSGSKSLEQNTPALKPGQSITTTIDHELARAGNYEVKVSADYNNKIKESNEANNENSIRFSIGRIL